MGRYAGYEILETLGARRGAAVFRARRGEEPPAILKVLDRDLWTGASLAQFRKDLELYDQLSHPRMIELIDSGEDDGDLWYAVADAGDRCLAEHLTNQVESGRGLRIPEIMRIARCLAEPLAFLHTRSIVHGDLDPSNLFFDDQGDLKVIEFHLGRAREGEEQDTTKLRYASPEQVQGDAQDTRSDVYQVGIVLYHALTGKLPREDENAFQTMLRRQQEPIPPPSKEAVGVTVPLDRMVLKCVEFPPENRYQTMGEFLAELERLDPETGELRPGEDMPGLPLEDDDGLFDSLYIPGQPAEKIVEKTSEGPGLGKTLAAAVLAAVCILGMLMFLVR